MGKTRDLFKKIRDTKGIFHAKMGTIKVRKCMYLTEAEDIRKRWQEHTELYKNDLHDLDNHPPRSRHPGIGSQVGLRKHHYKQSDGGDGIPVVLFQILKDDAVQVLHSIYQQIWENSAVVTGVEKVSFHFNTKERQCQRMFKLLQNCTHLTR